MNWIPLIEAMYLAFLGRPADKNGLDFYVSNISSGFQNFNVVANSIANSSEAAELLKGKSSPDIIRVIYNNLLGREPDPDGLLYWSSVLQSGQITLAGICQSMVVAAVASDKQVVDNKIAYAALLTNNGAVANATSPSGAVSRYYLSQVTGDTSYLQATKNVMDAVRMIQDAKDHPEKYAGQITNGIWHPGSGNNPSDTIPGPMVTTAYDASGLTVTSNEAGMIKLGATALATPAIVGTTATIGQQAVLAAGVVTVTNAAGGVGSDMTGINYQLGTVANDVMITSGAGSNVLYGFDGDDRMTAVSTGVSKLYGGAGDDAFVFLTSTNLVTGDVVDGGSYSLGNSLVLKGANQSYDLASKLTMTSVQALDTTVATGTINVTLNDSQVSPLIFVMGSAATETYTVALAGNTAGAPASKPLHLDGLILSGLTAGVDKFVVNADATNAYTTGYNVWLSNLGDQVTLTDGVNSVIGGSGNDTIVGGSGSDNIDAGAGDNSVTINHAGSVQSVTVGNGYNTIDLATNPNASVHLGPDGNWAVDSLTPNVVIENAAIGDRIYFTGFPSLGNYTLESFVVGNVNGLIAALENSLIGNTRSAAAQTYGGDTYIVASATGILGPTDTTIVKLVGVHGFNIVGGNIVVSS